MLYLTVWGVEPVVTHQTSWLESTGVCGVRKRKLVGVLFEKEPNVPLLVVSITCTAQQGCLSKR